MERNQIYNLERYLTLGPVAEILGVGMPILSTIVENGVIQPVRGASSKSPNLWGPEEVRRGFIALRLIHEFREKYGKNSPEYEYGQVKRDLFSTMRVRGPEIFKSEEWKKVVKRASEHGMVFKESIV